MSLNISPLKTVSVRRTSEPSLLQFANNTRTQGRFNDVLIQCDTTNIKANRMVLSCFSSYFNNIFEQQKKNDSTVTIEDIDGEILDCLIQYIYTGILNLNSENVLSILSAAHELDMNDVKGYCFEFLSDCISSSNCFTLLFAAKQHRNFALRDKVYEHIRYNYETVIQSPSFLTLERHEFFLLIYHLKVRFHINDTILCKSLMKWTKFDEVNRVSYFDRMIKFVNIHNLSFVFIKNLLDEKLIQENSAMLSTLQTKMEQLTNQQTKVLSIGGTYTNTNVKVVFSLDNTTSKVFPNLPIPFNIHCSLVLKNFIYCIGGHVNSDQVYRLNISQVDLVWEKIAPLKKKKVTLGATVFDDVLVVCGGFDGKTHIGSVEVYQPEQNKWNYISSLKQGRSGNQLVTLNGCLYTMGGWNGGETLSTVERLDRLDHTWKFVSSMQCSRNWFAAVQCNDCLYVIGGRNHEEQALKSVEKYDYFVDKWVYVQNMNFSRWGHSACVMQEKIFVIGGLNAEDEAVKEVDCYDPEVDRWTIVSRTDDILLGHSLIVL